MKKKVLSLTAIAMMTMVGVENAKADDTINFLKKFLDATEECIRHDTDCSKFADIGDSQSAEICQNNKPNGCVVACEKKMRLYGGFSHNCQ